MVMAMVVDSGPEHGFGCVRVRIGTKAYLLICASRSPRPSGSISSSIPGPTYGSTGVPPGLPVVVLGDGSGSYWRLRSQYWVYEP